MDGSVARLPAEALLTVLVGGFATTREEVLGRAAEETSAEQGAKHRPAHPCTYNMNARTSCVVR